MRPKRDRGPVQGRHVTRLKKGDDTIGRGSLILDQCARLRARDKAPGFQVPAVRENLAKKFKVSSLACWLKLRP